MSLRHRQLKRRRYYQRKAQGPEFETDQCWCGERNAHFAVVHGSCGGFGIINCRCGGDLCVCHNHGEVECLGCEDCEERDEEYDQESYDIAEALAEQKGRE